MFVLQCFLSNMDLLLDTKNFFQYFFLYSLKLFLLTATAEWTNLFYVSIVWIILIWNVYVYKIALLLEGIQYFEYRMCIKIMHLKISQTYPSWWLKQTVLRSLFYIIIKFHAHFWVLHLQFMKGGINENFISYFFSSNIALFTLNIHIYII